MNEKQRKKMFILAAEENAEDEALLTSEGSNSGYTKKKIYISKQNNNFCFVKNSSYMPPSEAPEEAPHQIRRRYTGFSFN